MGVQLPIPCGANPYLKVGLVDPQGKIVVMLDPSLSLPGVAFYRSTRREDVLLQKNGYRVLRLLVEDVCTDLDAALDDIQGCCNLKWLLK